MSFSFLLTKSGVIQLWTDVSQDNNPELIVIKVPMKVVHDVDLGRLFLVLVERVPAERHDHRVYGGGAVSR